MQIQGAVLEQSGAARPYTRSRPIAVATLQLDPPGPNEILVQIEAAGVCHSDLSVVDGTRDRPVPILLGHEAAGRVVSVGDGVDDLVEGQRVVMTFLPRCGECAACASAGKIPCTLGSRANAHGVLLGGGFRLHLKKKEIHHHNGVSGFATHAVVDRRTVVPVDESVPPAIAAVLGCAVLTGGGAVLNAAQPAPGDTLMVVGLGGVGMAALITAVSLEGVHVIGVDTSEAKLAIARRLGASATYTPAQVAEHRILATHVVEAAGHPKAFETAFAATEFGGRTVTVGLPAPDATAAISPLTITAQSRTIIGSYLGSAVPSRDIPGFVELWRNGNLPVEQLITSYTSLEDINQAMDTLADGSALRQMIMFN
ncbi:alcohol dehydrogenase catalytic domain-containing protein [Kribbella sp. NPDC050820]|uniref:alcohol dehydrogenase catalytic domain-containing protein n=1 Tax=Kribbella sp. NPDC050820 TaxID=3155408 RepID=UPI0033EAC2E7